MVRKVENQSKRRTKHLCEKRNNTADCFVFRLPGGGVLPSKRLPATGDVPLDGVAFSQLD